MKFLQKTEEVMEVLVLDDTYVVRNDMAVMRVYKVWQEHVAGLSGLSMW
jgi:hypothetical protein